MSYYDSYYQDPTLLAGLWAMMGTFWVAGMIVLVISLVAQWKINQKAGEPGWAAIVPVYNTYVSYKITWGNGWAFLFMLIPLVNVVIAIITMVKLAQVFGQGGGFAVGLVFLPVIFLPILAFGNAKYQGLPQR